MPWLNETTVLPAPRLTEAVAVPNVVLQVVGFTFE